MNDYHRYGLRETTPQIWHEPLKTGKRPLFSYRGKVWLCIALVYVACIVAIGAAFIEVAN